MPMPLSLSHPHTHVRKNCVKKSHCERKARKCIIIYYCSDEETRAEVTILMSVFCIIYEIYYVMVKMPIVTQPVWYK
jgi:hypothetical protein